MIKDAGRVLVVDDEQALARLVGEYLTRDGFDVDIVADGLAAVDAARTRTPDVVLLDLGLPGLDGIEVCRRLRTFSDCYVIMLTARADEIDKLIGLSVGADDYLTNPSARASSSPGCTPCSAGHEPQHPPVWTSRRCASGR